MCEYVYESECERRGSECVSHGCSVCIVWRCGCCKCLCKWHRPVAAGSPHARQSGSCCGPSGLCLEVAVAAATAVSLRVSLTLFLRPFLTGGRHTTPVRGSCARPVRRKMGVPDQRYLAASVNHHAACPWCCPQPHCLAVLRGSLDISGQLGSQVGGK